MKAAAAKANGTLHPEPPRRSARHKSPSPPRTNGIHSATGERSNEEPTRGDEPSSKKQKKALPPAVEENPDVDMHSPTSPTSAPPSDVFDAPESQHNAKKTAPVLNGNLFGGATKAPFPLKSSTPKEPSKLRFGFAAESDPDSPPPTKSASDTPGHAPDQPHVPSSSSSAPKPHAIPILPTPSAPSMAAKTSLPEAGLSTTESHPTKSVPKDPKQAVLLLDLASLPSFSFHVQTGLQSSPLKQARERTAASAVDPSSLPTFAFTVGAEPASVGFNWEAAGINPPVKATGSWTCGTCMVPNDANKSKCVSCEEPRPDSATKGTTTVPAAVPELPKPAAPTGGFNWAAAGLKMPTKAPGTWMCKVCMVDNVAAKTKCASCEEPRPDSGPALAKGIAPALTAAAELPKPVMPSGGFNWAAAGLKLPTKAPGTWICKVCMVDNDATQAKCISCEEPRA